MSRIHLEAVQCDKAAQIRPTNRTIVFNAFVILFPPFTNNSDHCFRLAVVGDLAQDSRDQDSFTVCGTGTNDQARGLRASDTEHSNGPCAFLDVRDVPIVAREQKGRLVRGWPHVFSHAAKLPLNLCC